MRRSQIWHNPDTNTNTNPNPDTNTITTTLTISLSPNPINKIAEIPQKIIYLPSTVCAVILIVMLVEISIELNVVLVDVGGALVLNVVIADAEFHYSVEHGVS